MSKHYYGGPSRTDWRILMEAEKMFRNEEVFGPKAWIVSKFVVEKKRRMRAAMKEEAEDESRIIRDEGIDGYISLEAIPAEITDEQTAYEYFKENIYMPRPHSQYDCTGKMFSSWWYPVCRNGRWYFYHRVSCDV